jgi:hypothetical protein
MNMQTAWATRVWRRVVQGGRIKLVEGGEVGMGWKVDGQEGTRPEKRRKASKKRDAELQSRQ